MLVSVSRPTKETAIPIKNNELVIASSKHSFWSIKEHQGTVCPLLNSAWAQCAVRARDINV